MGHIIYKNFKLVPGNSYSLFISTINENPWFYLGSNVPPIIQIYNPVLGKYLYPNGFSDLGASVPTTTALVSTAQGNLSDDASFGLRTG